MAEWAAEAVVGEDQARQLIGGQFPELHGCDLELLGKGWDNTVWLADGRWVFRFPRRAVAVPPVERQVAVLPVLAPLLPLATTVPAYHGRPGSGFPWPFLGAAFVSGREAASGPIPDEVRVAGAAPLGRFLRALHGAGPDQLGIDRSLLPVDANARTDMADRAARTTDWLHRLSGLTGWQQPSAVEGLLAEAVNAPPPRMTAIVHGDLHLRHLLVDDRGLPCAVIDWDDLGISDPAIDLPLLWAFIPPAGRAAFLDAYGPARDDQLVRSRLLAVFLSCVLAVYGAEESMPELMREATAGIERALSD